MTNRIKSKRKEIYLWFKTKRQIIIMWGLLCSGMIIFFTMILFAFGIMPENWAVIDWEVIDQGNFVAEVASLFVELTLFGVLLGFFVPKYLKRLDDENSVRKWGPTHLTLHTSILNVVLIPVYESILTMFQLDRSVDDPAVTKWIKSELKNNEHNLSDLLVVMDISSIRDALFDRRAELIAIQDLYSAAMTQSISTLINLTLKNIDIIESRLYMIKHNTEKLYDSASRPRGIYISHYKTSDEKYYFVETNDTLGDLKDIEAYLIVIAELFDDPELTKEMALVNIESSGSKELLVGLMRDFNFKPKFSVDCQEITTPKNDKKDEKERTKS